MVSVWLLTVLVGCLVEVDQVRCSELLEELYVVGRKTAIDKTRLDVI
jgi:hypothetical protein